ncbi:MAG: hypothetical protein IKQ18_04980 [Clostridia bacterium]|nr:hypothetical protein [Clostridia bacterium]
MSSHSYNIMQKIISWFKNYFYYYKWHVIIGAFVLFVVVFCVVQCSVQDKYEVYITYAGPDNIANQFEDIRSSVRAVYTTKDEKNAGAISIRDIIWVNEELAAQYIRDGIYYDASQNSDNAQLLFTEIASGNSFIYILDKQQYEKLKGDGAFEPLSDVFGDKQVECAIDEYGIDFKSTAFAKYFECYREWKGDLVLCLRSDTLSESLINRLKGSKQFEKSFKLHRQIFMDIVEFEVK